VYLVRHGKTDWSIDRRHTGRTDVALTADGRRRATALAPKLAGIDGIDDAVVLTSPLQRARETCALAGLGARAEVCDDLMEWDYGEFDGLRTADLRAAEPDWSIWTTTITKGESPADVAARADRVIARIDGAEQEMFVLFAHAHLLRILAARWCGLPPDAGRHLTLLPASISMLGYEREVRVIDHWNTAAFPT
jgi:broad specificity phosphatase PhoE